jgi:hypothetical protein
MDWIALLSAGSIGGGVGAIVTKILDVTWLSRVTQHAAHANWLRDQRLSAYAAAAEDCLSFGLSRKDASNPFEGYARLSKAMLLADDDKLAGEIDEFIVILDKLDRLLRDSTMKDDVKQLYNQLVPKARVLVAKMRESLTRV